MTTPYKYGTRFVTVAPSLVTATFTVPAACGGVTTVISVALAFVTVAGVPSNVTPTFIAGRFVPRKTTVLPPVVGPEVGDMPASVGIAPGGLVPPLPMVSAKSCRKVAPPAVIASAARFVARTVTVNAPVTPAGRNTASTLFLASAAPPAVDAPPVKTLPL